MKSSIQKVKKLGGTVVVLAIVVTGTTACDNTGSSSGGKGGQSGMPAAHHTGAGPDTATIALTD